MKTPTTSKNKQCPEHCTQHDACKFSWQQRSGPKGYVSTISVEVQPEPEPEPEINSPIKLRPLWGNLYYMIALVEGMWLLDLISLLRRLTGPYLESLLQRCILSRQTFSWHETNWHLVFWYYMTMDGVNAKNFFFFEIATLFADIVNIPLPSPLFIRKKFMPNIMGI